MWLRISGKFLIIILIPMIFVGMIPFSFAEGNTEQCKKVYEAEGLSLLERFAVYKICLDLIDEDTIVFPKKVSQLYKVINDYLENCDDVYPIFLQVHISEFHAMVKTATGCVKLYKSQSYHETGPDRVAKIYFDLQSILKKHLEETKEQRQKSLRDARIDQGQIMYVKDVFEEQEDKVDFLEKQIIEKNNKISENDIIIKDQLIASKLTEIGIWKSKREHCCSSFILSIVEISFTLISLKHSLRTLCGILLV